MRSHSSAKLELRCEWSAHARRVRFYLISKAGEKVAFGDPATLRPVDALEPQPIFELEKEEAQLLMDELWRSGIRPLDADGSVGALEATKAHLQDMRAIVFEMVTLRPRFVQERKKARTAG